MKKSEVFEKVMEHYLNACRKHPFFADVLCHEDYGWRGKARSIKEYNEFQTHLHDDGEPSYALAQDVMDAELAEIYAAYCACNRAQAIEEIYDAIAVLLRMEDMIRSEMEETGEGK